jgi:hypothetical protein
LLIITPYQDNLSFSIIFIVLQTIWNLKITCMSQLTSDKREMYGISMKKFSAVDLVWNGFFWIDGNVVGTALRKINFFDTNYYMAIHDRWNKISRLFLHEWISPSISAQFTDRFYYKIPKLKIENFKISKFKTSTVSKSRKIWTLKISINFLHQAYWNLEPQCNLLLSRFLNPE